MRFYKRFLCIVIAAVVMLCSSCDMFGLGEQTPNPAPHFMDESLRDDAPYIPLVERAKQDPTIYAELTQAGEKQIDEFMELLMDGKLPKIDVNDTSILQSIRSAWTEINGIFLNYTHHAMSNFERLHAFHDWLTHFVEYDFDTYNNFVTNPNYVLTNTAIFEFTGAINDKVAVCEGLANAYTVLCMLSGIPSEFIAGEWNGIPHAWNKVELDGVWYNVDVTADSQYMNFGKGMIKILSHAFFLISDDEITAVGTGDHIIYEGYYNPFNPECNHNYDVFSKLKIYSIGSYNYYARIHSADELKTLFTHVKGANRTIGKVEVQMDFPTTSGYIDEIKAGYNTIKNADFRVKDSPWIALPNNVFILLIYN